MANPYATEAFLRKQVRLRDKRIRALEKVLEEVLQDFGGYTAGGDASIQSVRLFQRARALLMEGTGEGAVQC